jgi:hypothetical protein
VTITNGYATLVDIKHPTVLNITDTDYDTLLEVIVEAASRAADTTCNRFFYSSAETRFYTAENPNRIFVDDMNSTASITIYTDDDGDGTYENTWASTDFMLMPENAALNAFPATYIDRAINGNYSFPVGVPKGVKITATFGWASVPRAIKVAVIMQSNRIFKRLQTPLGQSSMTALGEQKLSIPKLDPDICALIEPYRKLV